MTPEQAAHETRAALVSVPSRFMTDPATYAYGKELGFQGADFYVAGRGGALGDVPAGVVTAAFVFFAPDVVEAAWVRSANVMARADAAAAWAGRVRASAEGFPPDVDWPALAALSGRIAAAASFAGAPLFAAWRALPEPDDDPRVLALHRLNGLRELRGALHGAAVLTVGLSPLEAIVVRTPEMIRTFGWQEEPPDPLRSVSGGRSPRRARTACSAAT